jgi:hypothetical protein
MNHDIKQAWQAEVEPTAPASPQQARQDAERFARRIRRRNAIEYGAALLVLVIFSAYALFLPSPAARVGAAMILVGNLVVAWQLRRRASALPLPGAEAGMQPVLVHQRAQLARQRDALASIFAWYLLPFLPGLVVMMLAPAFDRGPAALAGLGWRYWLSVAAVPAILGLIWWLNRKAATRLARQVETIDAMLDEGK